MKIERKLVGSKNLLDTLGITKDRSNAIIAHLISISLGTSVDTLTQLFRCVAYCNNDNEKAFALFHYGEMKSEIKMYNSICENYHPQEAEQLIGFIINQNPEPDINNTAKVWSQKYYDEVVAIGEKNNNLEGVRIPKDNEEYFGIFQFSDLDNLKKQLTDKYIDPCSIVAEGGLTGALKIKFYK